MSAEAARWRQKAAEKPPSLPIATVVHPRSTVRSIPPCPAPTRWQGAGRQTLDAADYAAYSTVYRYGGCAVSDPDAFAPDMAVSQHAEDVARKTPLSHDGCGIAA